MLIQTSPHLHYRYTNVQLYNQKYVRLLGYIIDTDQTSKQENTTNPYICKVYTSIHQSLQKPAQEQSRVFSHARQSDSASQSSREATAGSKWPRLLALGLCGSRSSWICSYHLPQHKVISKKKSVINSISQADALATLKRSHFIYVYMYIYIYIYFINSVKCQFEII